MTRAQYEIRLSLFTSLIKSSGLFKEGLDKEFYDHGMKIYDKLGIILGNEEILIYLYKNVNPREYCTDSYDISNKFFGCSLCNFIVELIKNYRNVESIVKWVKDYIELKTDFSGEDSFIRADAILCFYHFCEFVGSNGCVD